MHPKWEHARRASSRGNMSQRLGRSGAFRVGSKNGVTERRYFFLLGAVPELLALALCPWAVRTEHPQTVKVAPFAALVTILCFVGAELQMGPCTWEWQAPDQVMEPGWT